MENKNKITVCLALGLLILTACPRSKEKNESPDAGNGPAYERVELIFYMLGDEPRDLPLIEKKLNEFTKRDLNCTVKLNYTTWSDYMQRYNLLLSSGQPIDLIFTSEWLYYNQYAKKGAFKPLDDLLPAYAPELYAFVPEGYWEAVKINGRIYTIPSVWIEYVNEGVMYRDDIRQKYGLPAPDSLENLEAYLDGIRRYEPRLIPTSEIVNDSGYGPSFSAMSALKYKYAWVDSNMPYGLKADYDKPSELYEYWGSDDFIEDMKMFKRWADKGFWTKSALSNKNAMTDSFINEYSVACLNGINPVKYYRTLNLLQSRSPGKSAGYYPYCRNTRLVKPVHPIHNGFAIPLSARNPERAVMFYEKLMLDKEYNRLTQYGIEGKHYALTEDGKYKMIGNVDTNGFTREAMNSWSWRNPDYMLFEENFDIVLELFREFDGYAKPDIFISFVEDYTPYQAERAALYQVQSQYLVPIQAGLVKDVDKAVEEFMFKARNAGLEKIQIEYSKQWEAYCRENNL